MTTEAILRAAHERAREVAQRADRPRQRRSAEHQVTRGGIVVPARIQLARAQMPPPEPDDDESMPMPCGCTPLAFHGEASVYETGYEMWDWYGPYTEVVSAGGGAVSLARADLDVPFVLAHDSLRRMARTTTGTLALAETDSALVVDAPQLDPCDADVSYIAPKLSAGLIDEMSFMFRIVRGQWSPDYTEYRIVEYDIHRGDVAIVGYGANPSTSGSLRGQSARPSRARALLELAIAR